MTRLQCARALSLSLSFAHESDAKGPWKWRAEAPEAIPTPIIPPVSSAPARSRQLARNWEGPGHSRDQSLLHSCLQWLSRAIHISDHAITLLLTMINLPLPLYPSFVVEIKERSSRRSLPPISGEIIYILIF